MKHRKIGLKTTVSSGSSCDDWYAGLEWMMNRSRDAGPLFDQKVIDEELGPGLKADHIRCGLAGLGFRHRCKQEARDEPDQKSRRHRHGIVIWN
jgi:hypothetical protein